MAFGQASGPPANARRVAELAALLEERGYDSFREARHPFDLTQRQAAGKFTTAEVDELMDRLQEVDDTPAPDGGRGARRRISAVAGSGTRRSPSASTPT